MTPFYEKARSLWQSVQNAQILKGLKKYPNPFNPHDWTPDELLNHALEETVDLTHYLVGLKELLDAKDKEIGQLKAKIRILEFREQTSLTELKINNRLVPKKSPFDEQEFHKYFDPDDQ